MGSVQVNMYSNLVGYITLINVVCVVTIKNIYSFCVFMSKDDCRAVSQRRAIGYEPQS